MHGKWTTLCWIMVFFAIEVARADVPSLLNYQGRVAVGGTNFDGAAQFKFSLVNGAGSQTFWSNGVNAVTSPVTKGLYSILLGDTNVANMASLLPTVFTNIDVRLRVWFAPQGDSLQLLSPDQRIAAAGYALSAANAAQFDGRSVSAFATSNHIHDAVYVNTGEVNSVTSAMVVDGTIATVDLASDAASLEKVTGGIMAVRGSGIGIGSGCVAGPLFQVRGRGITSMGVQNTTYHFNEVCGGSIWQSFTTPGSATTLAAVEVRMDTTGTGGTLNIYAGNGAGGTLLYGQPVVMVGSSGGQWQRFALTTPLALSASTQYTFAFSAGVNQIYESLESLSPYGGGQTWMADRDLQFILYATASGSAQAGLIVDPSLNVGIGVTAPSVALEVAGTVKAAAFIGNGAGLTNLNATSMTGTLALAQLPASVLTNNASGVNLTGSFTGNGAGMTNVNLLSVDSEGALGWTTNSGTFASASSLPLGAAPLWLVAGRLNGDTKPDLACVNYSDNTVMILANNGTGGFTVSSTITVGAGPSGIAAADFNGDGRLDLVTANYTPNTLSVLTNNGSGGMTVSSSPAVGRGPNGVLAVDVNNDGRIDLVSANYQTNTLSVLTNNGSGVFSLLSSLQVGNNPWAVVSADLNGDGKPDLVSANLGSTTLSVLTNNGSGVFLTRSTLVATNINGVAVVDVNGDGRQDLVYSDFLNNRVCVLTNNGAAAFTPSGVYAVGSGPGTITSGDVNGDGKPDLVVCNQSGNSLSVLINNGAGVFASSASLTVGYAPFCVTVNDLNGDGLNDVACVNQNSETLSVVLNTASYLATFNGSFSGSAAGLTNLDAADISGTLSDARLSTNVAFLAGPQVFAGLNRFAGAVTATNAANTFAGNFTGGFTGSFTGNGGSITNVNADQLDGKQGAFYQNAANLTNGTIPDARLSANVVTNGKTGLTLSGTFSGNGVAITNVNADTLDGQQSVFYQDAANLTAGTLADTRLSANVALLNANQAFTGSNRFAGVVMLTNAANTFAGAFTGNAAGLTNLDATDLSGTVPLARLPSAVVTNNAIGLTLTGSFTGNGAGLTNLVVPSAGNYIFSYATNTQAVSPSFQDITNQVDAAISGWTHTANTASFTCNQSGLYLIQYSAQGAFTASSSIDTLSLRAVLNGAEIAGSHTVAYGGASGTTSVDLIVPLAKSLIANVASGNVLKFQFTGTPGVALNAGAGSGTTKSSFSCTITRLQ